MSLYCLLIFIKLNETSVTFSYKTINLGNKQLCEMWLINHLVVNQNF